MQLVRNNLDEPSMFGARIVPVSAHCSCDKRRATASQGENTLEPHPKGLLKFVRGVLNIARVATDACGCSVFRSALGELTVPKPTLHQR